ncbi:MAG: glycosyltransferase family 4 protein [Actinomycetota bacterium]|nr:glycosyltransferase family 4 protein [Actinomycetota bacterium]
MRILLAITKGEIGGAQTHTRILAQGLQARGHRVGMITESPSALSSALTAGGAEVIPWASIRPTVDPLADARARAQLARAVREWCPDVLHLHSSKAGVIGRRLRPRVATVFTCLHASFGPGRRIRHRLVARPVEQLTLRHVDGLITIGARDMPMLRKLAPGTPLALIRNAVPVAGPPASPAAPVPVAVWVARLQHPKDPVQAIRSWETVIRRVPDARLLLCGAGPLEGAARRAAVAGPAAGNVTVLGRVPDVVEVHRRASVYVLATDVEGGVTMATLEAMAQGLVPVTSDAGDALLLEHARCGVVVPRRSPVALGTAVADLFLDESRLRAMRSRALAFAREGWSVDDMVDATVDFYEHVLSRHAGTARTAMFA